MEIKKREVIFSIIIIAAMLIIGFGISEKIRQNMLEKYQRYDLALKIDTEELFSYGMSTNVGDAFVHGDLRTIDPVTFSELEGVYSYVKKEEQEYRKHYRTVTKTYIGSDGKTKTKTEKEEYWTWDTMRTERKTATRISFLNVEFDYEKIPFPTSHHVKTISTGYHRRNVYYGTDTDFQGTIFTVLKEDTINETSFYKNRTISETIENLESGSEVVVFWVFWIILTGGLVVGFYYLENNWLD